VCLSKRGVLDLDVLLYCDCGSAVDDKSPGKVGRWRWELPQCPVVSPCSQLAQEVLVGWCSRHGCMTGTWPMHMLDHCCQLRCADATVQFIGASHMLVSASHDGTARVWDAWSGDCVSVLSGHSGRLNAVATSLDGSVIISCSDDNSARVWDGNTYKLIR